MTAATQARLFRTLDPSGAGVGFFVPMFQAHAINAPCLQVSDRSGRIAGFQPLELESYSGIDLPERTAEVGEPLVWTFVFAPSDVVLGSDDGRSILRNRLDEDPFFDRRPLLGLEVSEFLEQRDHRRRFAFNAYKRVAAHSIKAAGDWRDLSLLTPDVHAILRASPDPVRAIVDLRQIAVTSSEDHLMVHGVDQDGDGVALASIASAVREAFDGLAELYPASLARNLDIRFRKTASAPVSPRLRRSSEALLLLLDPELFWIEDALQDEPPSSFDLRATSLNAPRSDVSIGEGAVISVTPLDRLEPGQARGDLHFVLRSAGPPDPKERAEMERLEPKSVVVETPRPMNRRFSSATTLTVVRNAAAALGEARFELPGSGAEPHIYLQTSGVGTRPALDSLCQIYSRLWLQGHGAVQGRRYYTAGGVDDAATAHAADAMFPDVELSRFPHISRSLRPGACALLVQPAPVSPAELNRRHQRAVEGVLVATGWEIPDPGDPRGGRRTLLVRGERGGFDCATVPRRTAQREHTAGRDAPLAYQPLKARHVWATERADVDEVLAGLINRRELIVSLRDLAFADATLPPMVALLAAQTRRFAAGFPSRKQTRYMAMVTQTAFENGRVEARFVPELQAMVEDPYIDRRLQISCTRVVARPDHHVAHFQVTFRHPPLSPPAERLLSYRIVFDPDGLVLIDGEDKYRPT